MKNSKKIKIISFFLLFGCCSLFVPELSRAQQQSVTELVEQARQLGIEQASLEELQSRAQTRGIENQELVAIIQSAVALAGQKLPTDHIIQKALEGMSKGVPGNRITRVLVNIQQATEQSAQVVEPWIQHPEVQNMVNRTGQQTSQEFRNDLIKSASKAIARNASPAFINDILSDLSDEAVLSRTDPSSITAAVGILSDLPTTAAQPEVSRAFVVRALKGGFSAGELQKLPSALNMAQMRSRLPAASVIQSVANQLRGGIPAAQILQNLFNGNIGGGPPGNIPIGLENIKGRGQQNN